MRFLTDVRVLSLALILAGSCSFAPRQAVDCNDILETPLLSVPFDTLNRETGSVWIKSNYHNADHYAVDGGPTFGWRRNGKEYLAVFEPERKIITVSLSPEPVIEEVIQCFGQPDLYNVMSMPGAEGDGTRLSLWYLSRGVVFHYTGFNLKRRTRYDRLSSLNEVAIMKPGSIFDMARQIYSAEAAAYVSGSAKTWPTNLVTLELGPNERTWWKQ
ncbi:MAG: hypothetical protein ACFLMY_09485 [Candidatus Brachytrichaceae bacterium NZ_4S206]|jgi:hypothetical protein